MTKIIGIVLVRNEDLFVRRAVSNVNAFCDRILLADNGSTDGTAQILQDLAAADAQRITYHRIGHPRESHELIKPYAGGEHWVFGVDGDEIYDPAGLAAFRPRLLGGEFDKYWMILGSVLHCVKLEPGRADGHLSPPSRSITKMYNFSAIDSWDGDTVERLHGGMPAFRPGRDAGQRRFLDRELAWDASPLRCLHLCFLRRSSADPEGAPARENIMETHRGGVAARVRRWTNALLGRHTASRWKEERYCRGPVVSVRTAGFFSE